MSNKLKSIEPNEIRRYWNQEASDKLKGRTIVKVEYMSDELANHLDWYKIPIVMTLDNGWRIYPQCDDEGNDGGALFIEHTGETETHPSFPNEVFLKSSVMPNLTPNRQ